jgi:hypothetical protein
MEELYRHIGPNQVILLCDIYTVQDMELTAEVLFVTALHLFWHFTVTRGGCFTQVAAEIHRCLLKWGYIKLFRHMNVLICRMYQVW